MTAPQVVVSDSHADNDYCRAFVAALREGLGENDAVWYEEHNLVWGALRQFIDRDCNSGSISLPFSVLLPLAQTG